MPPPTPFFISNFVAFHLGHASRRERGSLLVHTYCRRHCTRASMRSYVRRRECTLQRTATPFAHKGRAFERSRAPPEREVAAIRTVGLDALLAGSRFNGVYLGSVVRCAIRRSAFCIDWDAMTAKVEYCHETSACMITRQVECTGSISRSDARRCAIVVHTLGTKCTFARPLCLWSSTVLTLPCSLSGPSCM